MGGQTVLARLGAAVAGAVLVTMLCAAGLLAGVLRSFDLQLADRYLGGAAASDEIALVGIDEAALQCNGNWPWTRTQQAELIDAIAAAGPKLIVYNVLLSTPAAGDDALAAALSRARNVILPVGLDRVSAAAPVPLAGDLAVPTEPLALAAADTGHAAILQESDGVVRTSTLVLQSGDGRFLLSLPAAAFAAATGADAQPIIRSGGAVQIGDVFVPAQDTSMRVNWSAQMIGRRPVSAAHALPAGRCETTDRTELAGLAGKIVFVGTADQGTEPYRLVPGRKSSGVPGTLVHASALNTMLTGEFVSPAGSAFTLGWVFTAALVAFAAAVLLPLWASALMGLLTGAASFLVVGDVLDVSVVPRPLYPLLGTAVAFLLGVGLRYVLERRQRLLTATVFGQFVPRPVVERLLRDDKSSAEMAAGERVDVTTFFCDLRGFTAMAAEMDPDAVRDVLNVYYDQVGRLIDKHGGTTMQYVGDEVFAVFGTPRPLERHAAAAVACARDVQDVEDDIARQVGRLGGGRLRYGIGLNSGNVIASAVGAGHRQYSVVGDTVNVGSRLCSLAEAGEVVLSEAVLERLDERPRVQWLGPVELKGVAEGFRAYRLPTNTRRKRTRSEGAKAKRVAPTPADNGPASARPRRPKRPSPATGAPGSPKKRPPRRRPDSEG